MTHATSPDSWFDDTDFMQLVSAACVGTLTVPDRDRLEGLLTDRGARDAYRLMMQVHADLAWRWMERDGNAVRERSSPIAPTQAMTSAVHGLSLQSLLSSAANPAVMLSTLVAVAAVLALVGSWMQSAALMGRVEFGTASGRVMAVRDAVWQTSDSGTAPEPRPGDLLPAGTELFLSRGLAEIAQPCGARVILEGPCEFTIEGGASLSIDRGRLTASLDDATGATQGRPGEPRFTVTTPTSVVTDLGTAFGVDVNRAGRTDVQVFKGEVAVAARRFSNAAPLRLTAGEAARLAPNAAARRMAAAPAGKYIRWMPAPGRKTFAVPGGIQWDESRAVTIYRDSFAGSGPLSGTPPASRGGVGNAAWIAPAEGWATDRSGTGLSVRAGGAAFLPFRPEPGFVYRLSVSMDVTAGGSGWAAIGFADEPNVGDWILGRGWMLQRHGVQSAKGRAVTLPNVAYAGPRQAGRVGDGDELCGPRTRTIILDTTTPTWRATFLVGEELVGECRFDQRPDTIRYVALSVFPDTNTVFHSFSLQSLSSSFERR